MKKPMFRRVHACPECGCRWSEGYRTEHRLRKVRGSEKILRPGSQGGVE